MTFSVSATADAGRLVKNVEKVYRTIRDYRARFTQTVEYTALGKSQTDTGVVFFKKPGRMRWEYDPPKSQVIVINSKKVWFYMPTDRQVLVEDARRAFSSKTPVSLLSGASRLRKYFDIKKTNRFQDKAHGITLQLIPKEPIKQVKEIYIAVDENSYIITDTFVVDHFDNVTHIVLSDIKINIGLPDELFTFTPPQGVEIIRPSEVLNR